MIIAIIFNKNNYTSIIFYKIKLFVFLQQFLQINFDK